MSIYVFLLFFFLFYSLPTLGGVRKDIEFIGKTKRGSKKKIGISDFYTESTNDTRIRDNFPPKESVALKIYMHWQCLWFVAKEGVCRERRADVHDEVVHGTMPGVHDVGLGVS